MKTLKLIPGRIDELRKQMNYGTQSKFCKAHPIDEGTYKKANDGLPVRPDKAQQLADIFGLPLEHLLTDDETNSPPEFGQLLSGIVFFAEDETGNGNSGNRVRDIELKDLSVGDIENLARCDEVHWRINVDDPSTEQLEAIEGLGEVFKNLGVGNSHRADALNSTPSDKVNVLDQHVDSFEYQMLAARSKAEINKLLETLKDLGLSVTAAQYSEFDEGMYDEEHHFVYFEEKKKSVVVISPKSVAITYARVWVGDVPPKSRESKRYPNIMINGRFYELPIKAIEVSLDDEIPF